MTRVHVSTTAELEWDSRGTIRSANNRDSCVSWGTYDMRASKMYVWPHLEAWSVILAHGRFEAYSEQSGSICTILDALA